MLRGDREKGLWECLREEKGLMTRYRRLIPSKTGNNHENYQQQPACDIKGHRTGISAEGANDVPPVENKAPIQAEGIGDN